MRRLLFRLIALLLLILSACVRREAAVCTLPCQLGINQDNSLSVQAFMELLLEHNWLDRYPEHFQATYARDAFSSVLETTTTIELDSPPLYGVSEITLYIGYLGTTSLDIQNLPADNIEAIKINTNIPLLLSWLIFGLPEGGQVMPFYLPQDLTNSNLCPNWSNYIAYHAGGSVIVRAAVQRPTIVNLWMTPVEIVYPLADDYRFSSQQVGRFERMDNIPCLPG